MLTDDQDKNSSFFVDLLLLVVIKLYPVPRVWHELTLYCQTLHSLKSSSQNSIFCCYVWTQRTQPDSQCVESAHTNATHTVSKADSFKAWLKRNTFLPVSCVLPYRAKTSPTLPHALSTYCWSCKLNFVTAVKSLRMQSYALKDPNEITRRAIALHSTQTCWTRIDRISKRLLANLLTPIQSFAYVLQYGMCL